MTKIINDFKRKYYKGGIIKAQAGARLLKALSKIITRTKSPHALDVYKRIKSAPVETLSSKVEILKANPTSYTKPEAFMDLLKPEELVLLQLGLAPLLNEERNILLREIEQELNNTTGRPSFGNSNINESIKQALLEAENKYELQLLQKEYPSDYWLYLKAEYGRIKQAAEKNRADLERLKNNGGYYLNGGKLKKFQKPSGPIYFSTNYGTIDPYALRENPYRTINTGVPGAAYDAANAILYAATPWTGGASLIPASIMTAARGVNAIGDITENGANTHNVIDAVTSFPIAGNAMRFAGKPVSTLIRNRRIIAYPQAYKHLNYFTDPVLLEKQNK